MKYIITGQDEFGNRIAATLETKTTRASKLLKRLDVEFQKQLGVPLEKVQNLYIGVLNKHTKIK